MRGVEQGSTGGGSRDVTGPGRGASRTWAGWPAGQTSSQPADTSNSSRRNACIARHDHACSRRREYMHVPMACPGSHEPTSLTAWRLKLHESIACRRRRRARRRRRPAWRGAYGGSGRAWREILHYAVRCRPSWHVEQSALTCTSGWLVRRPFGPTLMETQMARPGARQRQAFSSGTG
jgi:hypothetical protein